MKKHVYQLCGLAAAVGLALAACGGGSGSSSTPTGTVNVQVTDGPSDEFQNVWVTFTAIAFHTDPNAQWNPADATWQVIQLSSPQTINLATLNNGSLNNLFMGLNLPVGTYRQVRFLLDGPDAPLDASALATKDSNGAALQWNDQVEYLANGSTTLLESPLEIAYPTQGIQLVGTFDVQQNGTISLAVDFDLEHVIVPFNHDSMTYFTMRPNLQYFDMTQVGAITGTINTAKLCQTVAAAVSQTTACAYNLIVKAELLTPNGERHYVARQTTVDPLTGAFTLYPLATQDASGNPITSYDVLIRGREMETMLVTGVPVTAGTSPTGTDAAGPTKLPGTVTPILNSDEYVAQFGSALSPLSSGYAIFQQTLSGGVPYEVRWRNTDPFTGEFRNPIALQGATSPLQVASYKSFTFGPQTPVEGDGGFTVADNEVAYYTLATAGVMSPVAAGATQTFAPAAPALDSGVQSGTINVTLDFSNIKVENNCELVLARFASIIDTYDCSSFLSTNGGGNSGSFALTDVPAGDSATPVPGAYYYAYVRLWETGHGKATRLIVPLDGFIDLRSTTSATVNGSIVGE
ncbi:MAG TPA: DUF4382 domain-containing protein [Burkholderiaceae bacterium]|nr:DUF4382 domain-containing protein [Burkholderiaceae bacterium]